MLAHELLERREARPRGRGVESRHVLAVEDQEPRAVRQRGVSARARRESRPRRWPRRVEREAHRRQPREHAPVAALEVRPGIQQLVAVGSRGFVDDDDGCLDLVQQLRAGKEDVPLHADRRDLLRRPPAGASRKPRCTLDRVPALSCTDCCCARANDATKFTTASPQRRHADLDVERDDREEGREQHGVLAEVHRAARVPEPVEHQVDGDQRQDAAEEKLGHVRGREGQQEEAQLAAMRTHPTQRVAGRSPRSAS